MKEVIELLEKGKESEQCYRHSIGAICPCCMRFMKLIDQALSLLNPELLTAVCRKCDKPFQTTSDKDRLCPDCQEKPATGEWDEPEPSGELGPLQYDEKKAYRPTKAACIEQLEQRNKDLVIENKLLRLTINSHQRKIEQAMKEATDGKSKTL